MNTTVVLVHGAWHGAWCYERVIPLLAAHGIVAVARDLPAHGLNARFPKSYDVRPLDAAAFAAEVSPLAGTTLDDYANSIIATIDQVRAGGQSRVILVGHSMGGVAITAAAERVPDKIDALVYLTAFMPRSGIGATDYIHAPENAGELVGPQLLSDPAVTAALRIDHRSADPAYRARTRLAFYGDVSEADFAAAEHLMTPDVPVVPFATPIATTVERWGSLPRHYIKALKDRAILPALQDRFIAEADAFAPDNPTRVHELDTSHSPFIAAPAALADLLARIAAG
ncbi:MAG: alpha/beta fold hydrolase [Acidobacteria bacterium]|nr:alpha/beta fold hydrolase [Acidobacteriota bacterium]